MTSKIELVLPAELRGQRLDKALATLLPMHSRATLQRWLKGGAVTMRGAVLAARHKVEGGEKLQVLPPPVQVADWRAQDIALDIIFDDADFFVINKPPGLVVHPGAGNSHTTMMNALLHVDDNLRALPRAGIVHRLDKETSGLLVVARNEVARQDLIAQLQARSMRRAYQAVIDGVPVAGETIDEPIARHRRERVRMWVDARGKPAVTHVRVTKKFRAHSLIRAQLESGRTHQIRVHLAWRGFPIVGDKLYNRRVKVPPRADDALAQVLQKYQRQALHAGELAFVHPTTRDEVTFTRPPPEDFQKLVKALGDDAKKFANKTK